MLRELIRRGPDAGDNGPVWDTIFVDLREAIDPTRLAARGTESMVYTPEISFFSSSFSFRLSLSSLFSFSSNYLFAGEYVAAHTQCLYKVVVQHWLGCD